jgi:flagellar L-ring protein precursor FlgH
MFAFQILFILIMSAISLPAEAISLLQTGGMSQSALLDNPRSLIESYKARKVGDLITVRVTENVEAIKKSEIKTNSSTDHDASLTLRNASTKTTSLDPANNNVANTTTHFSLPVQYGRDTAKQISVNNNEVFTTLISALIVEIDPATGNMVVEGNRQIVMEGEMKSLYLRGIVNPKDIDANNELPSYKLANAQIQIVGSGALTKDRDSGILQKIFRKLF